MLTIKTTGEQICETRKELSEKYFDGFSAYELGNLGIISLLSDLQHVVNNEHYRQVLNDIKCILRTDERKI